MQLVRCLPRFRRADKAMRVLAERELWSREQIDAFQLDRLNELWAQTSAHVPYYASLTRRHRLPERFDSVEEFTALVPILPKAHVRQRAAELLNPNPARGFWTVTSGSTGTPMAAYWASESHRQSLAVKYRAYASWNVDYFDRTVFLWGHGASEAKGPIGWLSRKFQPAIDRMRNRVRISACDLSRPNLRNYLRQIEHFQPVMLYGYARALHLLACEAESSGFRCDALKLVVATSEPLWPRMIDQMQNAFGVDVAREYGSVECGIIATDSPLDRRLHVREDHMIVETLPREDGQYDIVVTVLNNPSFPLIRYAIGDVTSEPIRRDDRGFASLGGVAGRTADLLRTRKGENLHWIHVEYAVADTVQDVVRRFSMLQRRDGSVDVEVELEDGKTRDDAWPNLEALRREMETRLDGFPVAVRVVEAVRQTRAGKHMVVRSEVGDPVTSADAPQTLGSRMTSMMMSAMGYMEFAGMI